jgi:predicted alpha/beta-fold hydrolase
VDILLDDMGPKESRSAGKRSKGSYAKSTFESKFIQMSYASYSLASLRKVSYTDDPEPYDPNSYTTILNIIPGVIRLLVTLIAPYVFCIAMGCILLEIYLHGAQLINFQASSVLLFEAIAAYFFGSSLFIYYLYPRRSPIHPQHFGANPFGAYIKPGLYFSDKSDQIKDVLKHCPSLLSKEVSRGALPSYDKNGKKSKVLEPTPWMLTGDMRTLFPFVSYSPKSLNYVRRWIRVPLNDGPRCDISNSDKGGKYESVALDWLPPSSSSNRRNPEMAVIVLAGLTGGSDEGYILDLVSSIHERGWHAFVMLGRGLGGTPCSSNAFFHGARTVDLVASARVVKDSMPPETKICVGGISMGGVIVVNSFAKGEMEGIADCGCCIGGTFDTNRNRFFEHSRDLWQPLLTQGLKEAFAAQPGCMKRMYERLGPEAGERLDEVLSVADFDEKVITPLNKFRNSEHYYIDMSPPREEYANINKPFFVMHAQDDPILHVDSLPLDIIQGKGEVTSQMVALVTSTGGHVGWPLGLAPWKTRWMFQNSLFMEFCDGVLESTRVGSGQADVSHASVDQKHQYPDSKKLA